MELIISGQRKVVGALPGRASEREHKTSLDKIFPVPLALRSVGLLSPKIDLFLLKRNQRNGLGRKHYEESIISLAIS
jgi:hypothetical protein